MEVLRGVFPTVPTAALLRVMEICDYSVEAASEWILENDWRELVGQQGEQQDEQQEEEREQAHDGEAARSELRAEAAGGVVPAAVPAARIPELARQYGRRSVGGTAGPAPRAGGYPDLGLLEGGGRSLFAAAAGTGQAVGVLPTMVVSTGVNDSLGALRERHAAHFRQYYTRAVGDRSTTRYGYGGDRGSEEEDEEEEEEEEEDEGDEEGDEGDDDDDDDDEEDGYGGTGYYDSGDDSTFHRGLPPLPKRIKITKPESGGTAEDTKPRGDDFWVAFDDLVVSKNLIELLNTTLSKLAHSKVTLLNQPARELDEAAATAKLRSILSSVEPPATARTAPDELVMPPLEVSASGRLTLSRLLNSTSPREVPSVVELTASSSSPSPSPAPSSPGMSVGQKRKRKDDAPAVKQPQRGFFAHFFPVSDLDVIWRSVMHAHLLKNRFGETIEFHTASEGSFGKRDFDELTQIHATASTSRTASLGLSPFAALKCCLVLPCLAEEEEMFRVGKHLHSLLKLQGSLYYRVVGEPHRQEDGTNDYGVGSAQFDITSDGGKITENLFRRFARYRIKKEESGPGENAENPKVGAGHFLAHPQPRKADYCLQALKTDGWNRRLSS